MTPEGERLARAAAEVRRILGLPDDWPTVSPDDDPSERLARVVAELREQLDIK